MFWVRLPNGTQKSHWKLNSSVFLCTSWILKIVIHFWAFLLLCGLVSNMFTMFFRDSEVCLEGCNSYGDFGYLIKKSKNFILRKICKRTGCPSIVTLALLLFIVDMSVILPKQCEVVRTVPWRPLIYLDSVCWEFFSTFQLKQQKLKDKNI